jgi:PPOX class probable F420-dependent enzyme
MTAAEDLQRMLASRTVLLETRKRDGSWVGTPINLASADGHVYFRTWNTSGKAKRLRNFPDARVAPSTMSGKPTGDAVTIHTRLLDGDEAERARTAINKRFPLMHGVLVPLTHRAKKVKTVHYEATLAE